MSRLHTGRPNASAQPEQILLSLLKYDRRKRFETLREEIQHFINAVQFRIGTPPVGSHATWSEVLPSKEHLQDQKDESDQNDTSQKAFLYRMLRSARALRSECNLDRRELTRYTDEAKLLHLPSEASSKEWAPRAQHFDVLWHALWVYKATVIAERLGNLHDRLDQFLQRTNPDHPDPTLRRRSEQGLPDKYLSELTRWVHRDLALLVKSMGARYPYDEVPSTYQSWTYDFTSRHHAFIGTAGHKRWANTIEGIGDPHPPEKFTVIELSYWLPERQSLHPIIGHEIAHQVIRDIYGRHTDTSILEEDDSELSRAYRRLLGSAEAWLDVRIMSEGFEPRASSILVQEVLCDALAACRFGYAYLYSWLMEMLTEERLAQLFHDRFGMLRRMDPESSEVGSEVQRTEGRARTDLYRRGDGASALQDIAANVAKTAKSLSRDAPKLYYRGRVLSTLLKSLDLERDTTSIELAEGFDHVLELLLEIFTNGDAARQAYEREFARDLCAALCEERADADEANSWGDSGFVSCARKFWRRTGTISKLGRPVQRIIERVGLGGPVRQTMAEPTLQHQLINESYRDLLRGFIASSSGSRDKSVPEEKVKQRFDWPDVKTHCDVAWRLEWITESRVLRNGNLDPQHANQLRTLGFLGMEDYLYRTANPRRLFSVIASPNTKEVARRSTNLKTNCLDLAALEMLYDSQPIRDLDCWVKAQSKNSSTPPTSSTIDLPIEAGVDPRRSQITVPPENFQWLSGLLLSGDVWTQMLCTAGEPSRLTPLYQLELLRIRIGSKLHGQLIDINERSDVQTKYRIVQRGVLLGRYDAFVLSEQQREDGEINWGISSRTAVTSGEPKRLAASVSRSKRVVLVGEGDAQPTLLASRNSVALILVSLKWEASRTVVARWLTSMTVREKFRALRLFVFLSDGWEDIVIMACAEPFDSDEPSEPFKGTIELLRHLNANPFIAGSETLFSANLVAEAPINAHFRFSCRIGESMYQQARQALEPVCAAFDVQLRDVAGNKDFEVSVDSSSAKERVLELYSELHEKLPDGCRMETRVAWTR